MARACPHCNSGHPVEAGGRCPLTSRIIDSFEAGEILDGKFEIERELAGGGMGVVYVARHIALGRQVAVKVLRGELASDPELASRFEQEARAASAIGHPNIIQVHDLGRTSGGMLYMVMELLAGRTLTAILEEHPRLPVARAIRLIDQVLSALGAAHKNGIVHRDLKPDNVFIVETEYQPDFVKLLDFGISKILPRHAPPQLGAARKETMIGTVMGTPEYMAPEQARGSVDQMDARSDLYAAGVLLYEMLCGRTPFTGDNYNAVMAAILEGTHVPPRKVRASVPERLEQVIEKAMALSRDARWPSAQAMREALVWSQGALALHTPPMGTAVLELDESDDDEEAAAAATAAPAPAAATPVPAPVRPTPAAPVAPAARPTPVTPTPAPAAFGALSGDGISLAALDEVHTPAPVRVAAATPVPGAQAARPAAPAHDPFAAPDSDGDEGGGLLLADEKPRPRPSAAGAAVPSPGRASAARAVSAPSPRTVVEMGPHARPALRGNGGSTLRWILVALLLGGAVAAGVVFKDRLPFLAPKRVAVTIMATPPDAAVRIDGAVVVGQVRLAPGPHELSITAPGYVARTFTVEPKTGEPVRATLWRPVPTYDPLDPAPADPLAAVDRLDWAAVDALTAKVSAVRTCVVKVSGDTRSTAERFAEVRATPGGRPGDVLDANAHWGLDGAASCLEGTHELDPADTRIEEKTRALAVALRHLAEGLRSRGREVDGKKFAALWKDLGARFAGFVAADTALRGELAAREWRLERATLALVEAEAGRHAAWHLRAYLIAAVVEARGGPSAAPAAQALATYCASPEGLTRCPGAAAATAAQHQDDKKPETLNAAIAAFNGAILD